MPQQLSCKNAPRAIANVPLLPPPRFKLLMPRTTLTPRCQSVLDTQKSSREVLSPLRIPAARACVQASKRTLRWQTSGSTATFLLLSNLTLVMKRSPSIEVTGKPLYCVQTLTFMLNMKYYNAIGRTKIFPSQKVLGVEEDSKSGFKRGKGQILTRECSVSLLEAGSAYPRLVSLGASLTHVAGLPQCIGDGGEMHCI